MNPLISLARSLGKQEWFAKVGRRSAPADLALQRWTGGRVSPLGMIGLPSLVLTTTGRRSGQQRSVPLQYTPHGREYVVVASNWGQCRHPGWSANLLAHPQAEVWERGRTLAVRARLATGDERQQLWREVTAQWPAYDTYDQRAGEREIRLFVLSPQERSSAESSAG